MIGLSVLAALPGIGMGYFSTAGVTSPTGPMHLRRLSKSTTILDAAEESLGEGLGPAGGLPMECAGGAGTATCSTTHGVVPRTNVRSRFASSPSTPSFPHASTPSSRYGASVSLFLNNSSFDVLLFGGANDTGYVFNDTWQFSDESRTWWNVTPYLNCAPASCPTARHDAAMTWDYSDGYAVLFGGCSIASPGWTESLPGCDGNASHIDADTWTYSDSHGGVGAWRSVTPVSSPPKRYAEGLADDRSDGYLVLFGGCGLTCPLGDTWAFTNNTWTNLNLAVHPAPRFGMAMSLAQGNLSTRPYLVALFGGCVLNSLCQASSDGSWLFYGGTWHQAISSAQCASFAKVCPGRRVFMAQTAYYGPTPSVKNWSLVVFGGVGEGLGHVYGNGSGPDAGWWAFEPWNTTASWVEFPSLPGWDSAGGGYRPNIGWYGPAPLGPPAPRYNAMLVGNNITGGLLFGGSSSGGSSLGDTWFAGLVADTPQSSLLWPVPLPPAEYGGSMVYDPADRYDVMLEGCGPDYCPAPVTWNYTANSGMPWGDMFPALGYSGSPPARFNASMVYFNQTANSSAVGVLLFGGLGLSGNLLNDLWEFKSGVWSRVTLATGSPQPSPRQSAAFTFVPTGNGTGYALLFGGCGRDCPLADTWILQYKKSGFSWTEQTPAHSPSGRWGASLAYDAADQQPILFGGCGNLGCPLNDTWSYVNSPTPNWIRCTASSCTGSHAPSGRWGASMTYDSTDGEVILFGGCGRTCPLGDTWAFAGGSWTELHPTPSPPARYDAAISNDARGGFVLMEGGVISDGLLSGGIGWAFRNNSWYSAGVANQLQRDPAPVPRYGLSLAYNSTGGYMLMFGGCENPQVLSSGSCGPLAGRSDTWEYLNGTWRWLCNGCGPSARWDAGLAFDAAGDYFVMVGGCSATEANCTASSVLSDSWRFGNGVWTPLANPPFPARGDESIVWDALDSVVVLFGGIGCSGVCGDSWYYQGGSWHPVTGNLPSPRFGAPATYDAAAGDQYVLLTEGNGGSGIVRLDTCKFILPYWYLVSNSGPLPARFDAGMTFDASNGYVVLFGGLATQSGDQLMDVWSYESGKWTELDSGTTTIDFRWGMGFVFDPTAGPGGFTILFGGSNAPGWASSPLPTDGGCSVGQSDTLAYSEIGMANESNWTGLTLTS